MRRSAQIECSRNGFATDTQARCRRCRRRRMCSCVIRYVVTRHRTRQRSRTRRCDRICDRRVADVVVVSRARKCPKVRAISADGRVRCVAYVDGADCRSCLAVYTRDRSDRRHVRQTVIRHIVRRHHYRRVCPVYRQQRRVTRDIIYTAACVRKHSAVIVSV